MNQGILILAEHLKGEISEITYEMLGVGRKLAEDLKVPVYAVLIGNEVTPLAARLGAADAVFVVEQPLLNLAPATDQAALLKLVAEQKQASLILVGGTNVSMGIGSVLSAHSGLPFVSFCKNARFENGILTLTSQLFGGKILADVKLADNRGIIGVYPGSFSADAGRSDKTPPVERLELPVAVPKVTFKRYIEPETGDVDITKQEVLIAVGRGIQTQDNVVLAEELAQAMSGAVCASRPVIDQGWLPLSRQVGKSGMIVKPRLYLALGISGAPEHIEGMQGSQITIAINTDAKAPIFDVAQYGYCGDALDILPTLTEKIKAYKPA